MDKFFPDIGNNFIVDPFCGAQSKYGLPDADPANVLYYILCIIYRVFSRLPYLM